ncbi:kelch-like protein 9 [Antedon mediterranea]|uniref:kelch-like protein 9 n=1 Tax=Antedon mediterranea TaxID=105859 RepID=UPI003AF6ECC4
MNLSNNQHLSQKSFISDRAPRYSTKRGLLALTTGTGTGPGNTLTAVSRHGVATCSHEESSKYRPRIYHNGIHHWKDEWPDKATAAQSKHSCECSQASAVLHVMAELWKEKQLNDVVLAVDIKKIGAHKLVLSACSDFFRQMFTKDSEDELFEYSLHGIEYETLSVLLEFIYTTKLHVSFNNVEELLKAADYLKINLAIEICCHYLNDNLCRETCLKTLSLISNFENMPDIEEAACKVIATNFLFVTKSEDFNFLPYKSLLLLISRDDLIVDSELQVFEAVMSWINVDDTRLKYALNLLENVRLPMIKPPDLVDHVEPKILRFPLCEELLKEALHYHCLPLRQSILQSPRTAPRSMLKIPTVVAVGGHPRLANEPVCQTIHYFNSITQNWSALTEMIQPRHHHAVVNLGGFLYIIGGRETTNKQDVPLKTAFRYDPRTDSWIQIADMKRARESFQVGVLDGKIYAVGGRVNDSVSLADVERYNPLSDEWEAVASLSSPRRCIAVQSHSKWIFAIGGSGNLKLSNKVERFDCTSNRWMLMSPLASSRFFAMLLPVGHFMYLIGGATVDTQGHLHCMSAVDKYHPATDTWTMSVTHLPTPRAEASGCVVKNRIYILGGYSWDSEKWLDSVECYDVKKDDWLELPNFPKAYTGMACCSVTLHKLP